MAIDLMQLLQFALLVSALLMILGLRKLGHVPTAKQGNFLSASGMGLALFASIAAAIWSYWALGMAGSVSSLEMGEVSLIRRVAPMLAVLLLGGLAGLVSARLVKMTAMPELVAIFNGFGGLASLGLASGQGMASTFFADPLLLAVIIATIVIGGACFSGSLIAWGKLSGRISGGSTALPLHNLLLIILLLVALSPLLILSFADMPFSYGLPISIAAAFLAGILLVIRVGGADMPIIVSLLNAFSGLAAALAGFAVNNILLIVAGALVGASGLILTQIMTKAMNRSLRNVLLGGMAADAKKAKKGKDGEAKGEVQSISVQDAWYLFESARDILVVPGYGLAVAQAQHALKELADLVSENGAQLRYAIHPVAGRMPGHMNVLLAEANIPYEAMVEPGDVNPLMETVDLAVVVGANDVVNPDAREDTSSPLYGMPIIEVDRASNVIILKRSMAAGFSGVENALFYRKNGRMLFGDAKASLSALAGEFKNS